MGRLATLTRYRHCILRMQAKRICMAMHCIPRRAPVAILDKSMYSYDTPPGGDFARYVDQLLAKQSVAAQPMMPTKAVPPVVGRPNIGSVQKLPAAGAVVSKADELLERIRQLETRKGTAPGKTAPASPMQAERTAGSIFAPASTTATATKTSGLQTLGWATAAVLGVIFPPLGAVMLLGLLKKAFSNKAKN